MVFTTYHYIGF